MRYLFIHQNFPGQFRHIVNALAADRSNEVTGIGEAENLQGKAPLDSAIRILSYKVQRPQKSDVHHYLRDYEAHIRRGQAVVRLLLALKKQENYQPDVVIAHPGWGEGLFLKDMFPDAKHIQYFEYYYQTRDGDINFDPEFPSALDDHLRVRIKNSTQLQSMVACDKGISPTLWQKSRYPVELQHKIEVIHEGVDTQVLQPDGSAWIQINGQRIQAGDEVVTFVARNLEPYRGFHVFIRTLPLLQKLRPNARVIIVGGDDVSYGKRLPEGQTYRKRYCAEVQQEVDWSKVHFVGRIPYKDYVKVLQISAAHVYLTYPFVLSWSMLEAMSTGCLLIASNTAPVKEVVEDGRNGILVDFFDREKLAATISNVLEKPAGFKAMREQARKDVVDRFDLNGVCLPKIRHFINNVLNTSS